jgi:hypothetical protein
MGETLELVGQQGALELFVYTAGPDNTLAGTLNTVDDLRIVRRYHEPGAFEMRVPVSGSIALRPGMLVWPKGEAEAFVVETTLLQETEEGEFLEASGRTCAAYLARRALFERRHYEGTGAAIIGQMLDATFSDSRRVFPRWSYAVDTALGDQIRYDYETATMTLLDAIVAVCKATGLGFRCAFDRYTRDLRFSLYQGMDRTVSAVGASRIAFDSERGNIQKMRYTESVADAATVAYVLGEKDAQTDARTFVEYDPGALTGYARFEAALESGKTRTTEDKDASGNNIKLTEAQYLKLLADYGKEKLAGRDVTRTTEGELLAGSRLFLLGKDYDVGDIVEIRNAHWGVLDTARITEIVFSYSQGFVETSLTVGNKLPTLLEKMTRNG